MGVSPPRRWGAELKPVVNTSLPAQLAPKLVPVTLAAATAAVHLTNDLQPIRLSRAAPTNVTSMEDFPSLGAKKTFKTTPITPNMSFAALSRDWAQKQKEEEDKAKEEAHREACWAAEQRKEREKLERDERDLRKAGIIAIPQLSSKKSDNDDERYKEEEKKHLSDEDSLSDHADDDMDDDDDEDEFGCDGVWDSRKHRDELY